MNLYLILFLILVTAVLLEWFYPQHEEKLYAFCWILMSAILCFRFGQGTDYVTYHAIYKTIPVAIDFSQGYICGFYPEIGWRLLSAIFKLFHAPFWVFTAVLGLAEMLLIHRFLKKYVPMKVAGLFLLYPVLFLVYMVSGIRQGLAMCLFLGLAVPYYIEKKWIKYIASVFLLMSFHKVGFVWLFLLFIYYLPWKYFLVTVGLSMIGGMLFQIEAVANFVVEIVPIYQYHLRQFLLEGHMNLFAMGERLISFFVLLVLYFYYQKKEELDKQTELFMKAYGCGLCFYMIFVANSYYASRYAVGFKILEVVLVVFFVKKEGKLAKLGALFFFCLTMLMGVKNMNAMVSEGGYAQLGIKLWNYPYVSIFQAEEISQYFDYEKRLNQMYQFNIEDQELWRIED